MDIEITEEAVEIVRVLYGGREMAMFLIEEPDQGGPSGVSGLERLHY